MHTNNNTVPSTTFTLQTAQKQSYINPQTQWNKYKAIPQVV